MKQKIHNKKEFRHLSIALVGGLTAGPIMPLLAIRQTLLEKHPDARFIIIDVVGSVGESVAKRYKVNFTPILAGKLRRYFSWRTLITPFQVLAGFVQSLRLLRQHRITQVVTAGGFVQVPVTWAAWLLRIPVHIHQQDIEPTLANRLSLPTATSMSVTFESSLRDFPRGSGLFSPNQDFNIAWTGNPVRAEILSASKVEAQRYFKLDPSWPTLFVLGGGSGAVGLNELVYDALPELVRTVQVIHSTGKGKLQKMDYDRYHPTEFIARTELAYAAADIVVTRAGIGTMTELANLGKVSIIIPMPDTHQESNAALLYKKKAALVLDQRETSPADLIRVIRKLLFDLELQKQLAHNIGAIMPRDAAKNIINMIGL